MNETAPASHAHHGEDLAVLEFFGGRTGVFVEAGANHPVIGSQTWLLEQRGWSGVLIEPTPWLAELCRRERPNSRVFECALVEPGGPAEVRLHTPEGCSAELAHVVPGDARRRGGEFITCRTRTLDEVLSTAGLETVDFFSIDIEGCEIPALRGFAWSRWRPRLLSIEDHSKTLALTRFVRSHGYRFLRRIGDNDWYVPADSPHRATAGERLRFLRKKYLSLPLRKLRVFFRRLRGKEIR